MAQKSDDIQIHKDVVGTFDGKECAFFYLKNQNGSSLKLLNYGARITEFWVRDASNEPRNVVLGFATLAEYLKPEPYFGATIGRVANRIAGGTFCLGDRRFETPINNGPNTLHGGVRGFDKRVWDTAVEGSQVVFRYLSANGEEGFPGNVQVSVSMTLTNTNSIEIEYEAFCDDVTPLSLTNHAYFNLNGAGSGEILEHELLIEASHYLPVDDSLIPTGEVKPVAGTPFDFRAHRSIGSRITSVPGGYDHHFVCGEKTSIPRNVASVSSPASGIRQIVLTTEPGLQFYSGNFLDGSIHGVGGCYFKHGGYCLEAQQYPNAINENRFPSILLRPGERYFQKTCYCFEPIY